MSGLFLQLLGTDAAGRKLAFRARLEGSAIKTSVHDLVTGQEIPATLPFRGVYRITFLEPANEDPITTFDLLPDVSSLRAGSTANTLRLELRVRCLTMNAGSDASVRIEGDLGVVMEAGSPRIEARGLRAILPPEVPAGSNVLFFEPSGDHNFLLEELRQDKLTEIVGLNQFPLLPIALGLGDEGVGTRSMRAAFRSVRIGTSRQSLLSFELIISLDDTKDLLYRGHRLGTGGDSKWRFVQRMPTPEDEDPKRDQEPRANRWIVSARPGEDAQGPFFSLWNRAVAEPYIEGLRTIRGGRAISLLPIFEETTASPGAEIPLLLFFEWREPDPQRGGGSGRLRAQDFHLSDDQETQPAGARLRGRLLSVQPDDNSGTQITSALPGLLAHEGEPLKIRWFVTNASFEGDQFNPVKAERARGIVFRAIQQPLTGNLPRVVRIGSLDFTFSLDKHTDKEISTFAGDIVRKRGIERLDVEIASLLAVTTAAPGGQDSLPQDEFAQDLPDNFKREPAIVIPVGESSKPRRFLLEAGETTFDPDDRAPRSQTLVMRLLDLDLEITGEAAKPRDVVVLDRQPFLVAKVGVPPLQGIVQEGIREVANWSGDSPHSASWELQAGEGFTMHLPPQGVGEAMEKIEGPTDIKEGEAADFRFTPPARFDLQASFFEQRFAEAPWNLRRILGYPGQEAPGAGIRNLRFEMLYGMECEVDTPFLHLAEIAARLGEIQGDLPAKLPWKGTLEQDKALTAFRKEWGSIFERYFSRLAILEPWDAHQPDELTLDDGVHYQLRSKADLRFPVPGEEDKAGPGIPKDPNGLAGGVAWGFESTNIYNATWRDPKSTSGKLVRPYFSALGGWGFQKASFDKDRTTIYSDTAMGRTFFLSLERIGRIGTLWNVAKHVIIYERTVAPSEQFFDKQDHHAGRPLLRKVEEFVEILQPTRSYPEFGAAAVTRGFITASEFKTRIIHVDSAWGSDVGTIGWHVPLWRPDEAAKKPAVYPKPHVLLHVAADPEAGAPTIGVEIDEPEKLVFYTDTRPETDARTDLWPAIHGIDYLDLPRPIPPAIPSSAGENLDGRLPDAPAVAPGYERFTWAVLPAERGTNVVLERADDALAAVIRNVTMMRSNPRSLEKVPQVVQEVARLTEPIDKLLQEVLARVPTEGQVTEELIERLKREVDQVSGPLKDLRKQIAGLKSNTDIAKFLSSKNKLCEELKAKSDSEVDRLAAQATALVDSVRRELLGILQQLQGGAQTVKAEAKRFVDERIEELRRIVLLAQAGFDLVAERLAAIRADLKRLGERIGTEIDGVRRLTDELQGSAVQQLDRLRRELRELRTRLATLAREADSKLAGVTEPRFANLVQKARQALAGVRKQIDDKLAEAEGILARAPSELEQIKRDFKAALQELQNGVTKALDFSGAVTSELDAAVQKLSDAVSLGLKILEDAQKAAEEKIDATFVEPERLTQALVDALGDELVAKLLGSVFNDFKTQVGVAVVEICSKVLEGLEDAFTKLLDNVLGADATAAIERIKSALGGLAGKSVEELRRKLQGAIEDLGRELAPLADQLQKGLRDTLGGAVAQLADNTLRLLRAFGDAPIVPGLDFNRRQIAYFFDELKKAVDLTPVVALVNRIGDELKGLGLRIPTGQLLDRILPNPLQGFDLSKIFPDFAGLKLDGLFPGLRMPAIANDNVKVTHGVDPQSRRAWVQADVNVPINEPTNVFSTGPIAVRLLRSQFQARARVEASLDGPPRQTVSGRITGDWQISVLSTPIVVFRNTALIFEDGRLRFDLSPDKVELTAALRFLADLMKKIGYSEGGFSVRLLEEGGLPVGVQSVLDLPLPDMAAGAFAVTSLRLGSTFTLKVRPAPGGVDFLLSTTFNLGRKQAPFALTIAILTGGGWLEAEASYAPRSNQLATRVSVGVVAGGSLAFAFGPVRGGVYIFFGIEAEFESRSGAGGGQSLNIAILLLVRGEVQIFGFISVGIHLLLQAQYQQSGRLIGTGTLSLSIKISWFVTINVSTSVRYEFAKGSGGGSQNELAAADTGPTIRGAASDYIGMLD